MKGEVFSSTRFYFSRTPTADGILHPCLSETEKVKRSNHNKSHTRLPLPSPSPSPSSTPARPVLCYCYTQVQVHTHNHCKILISYQRRAHAHRLTGHRFGLPLPASRKNTVETVLEHLSMMDMPRFPFLPIDEKKRSSFPRDLETREVDVSI